MKIKLSKSQWEAMGKQAGWMKKEAAVAIPQLNGTVTFSTSGIDQARAVGSTPLFMDIKLPVGEWTIDIHTSRDPDLASIFQEIMGKFGTQVQQAGKQNSRQPQQPQQAQPQQPVPPQA